MEKDINNLNICMNTMKTDIGYIKDALVENKEQHKEIMDKMEEWIAASKKEFAPMIYAKILIWVGIGIGGALIATFMNSVLK